jgi:hypothetical protein
LRSFIISNLLQEKEDDMGKGCSTKEKRNAYNILMGKPEG